MLRINDEPPNFIAETSHGTINFHEWIGNGCAIEETQGHRVNYPMIGDPQLEIAKLYGMLPADGRRSGESRKAVPSS